MHTFDEMAWRLICQQAARNAVEGSGQSETMWLRKLHFSLESQLKQFDAVDQGAALAIAKQCGYVTDRELEDDAKSNAACGFCVHGIDPKSCPAGCGDQDEYQDLGESD